ncbi:hypothetical protein LINPERHAP1_LOCUS16720, partial [Linum perenne]
ECLRSVKFYSEVLAGSILASLSCSLLCPCVSFV